MQETHHEGRESPRDQDKRSLEGLFRNTGGVKGFRITERRTSVRGGVLEWFLVEIEEFRLKHLSHLLVLQGMKLTELLHPSFPLGYEYAPYSPVFKNARFAAVRSTPSKHEETLSTEELLVAVFQDA